jgi:hypothetical protein
MKRTFGKQQTMKRRPGLSLQDQGVSAANPLWLVKARVLIWLKNPRMAIAKLFF